MLAILSAYMYMYFKDIILPLDLCSKFKMMQIFKFHVPVKTLGQNFLDGTRTRGYKTFFKLSSAEHEISTAHKC